MQSAPIEVSSPKSKTLGNIDASIFRIKGNLREIHRPKTARDASPVRHYLTPTAASVLKSREKSPIRTYKKPPENLLSAKRK